MVMNIELYFKKVYTVAYRLTGDREIAEEISELAIINTVSQLNENYKVTASLLQLTILELFKIFLKMTISQCHDDLIIQNSLLKLNPVNRVVVVWKDVLGYQISSNIPIADYTYDGLVVELLRGRRELKELINLNEG
jgi:hypothetical protein